MATCGRVAGAGRTEAATEAGLRNGTGGPLSERGSVAAATTTDAWPDRPRRSAPRSTGVRSLGGLVRAAGLAVAGGLAGPAAAEPCLTAAPERVWAESVRRGDEIVLVDGRVVRLAAIETPRGPLGGSGDPAIGRFAAAARTALATAVEGRELELFRIGTDRWGRERGHLVDVDGGDWIQAGLVAAGFARVVPTGDDRACARALLGEEARARRERRGLWAVAAFALRDPVTVAAVPAGTYVVVEGVVRSIGHSGRRTYLDFGGDFRRDFAIVLDDKDRDRLKAAGFDVARWRGRTVRVRGDLVRRDGPRITVEVPEEIERVER